MLLLYGSQNFGYNTEKSDKDWLKFVYPTFDDLMNNVTVAKELRNEDGSITKVKDVRLIYKMLRKSNFTDLQFMYSTEMYDSEPLEWFFENRERLVRANLQQLYISNYGLVYKSTKSGKRTDLVRGLCYTELIERAFSNEPFSLRVEGLKKYRINEELEIDTKKLMARLEHMRPLADKAKVDSEILDKAYEATRNLMQKKIDLRRQ